MGNQPCSPDKKDPKQRYDDDGVAKQLLPEFQNQPSPNLSADLPSGSGNVRDLDSAYRCKPDQDDTADASNTHALFQSDCIEPSDSQVTQTSDNQHSILQKAEVVRQKNFKHASPRGGVAVGRPDNGSQAILPRKLQSPIQPAKSSK